MDWVKPLLSVDISGGQGANYRKLLHIIAKSDEIKA